VENGTVSEIRDPEAEVAPAENATAPEDNAKMVQTDKGVLSWDNEDEDLKEGDAVYVTDEEGNRQPAPDGEYTTEDGKVITVVDGKVASINDPAAEVSEEGAAQEELAALRSENETLSARVAELTAQVEELTAQVAKMQATPAAKPAHEDFNEQNPGTKTGVKGLDNLSRIMGAK